MRAGLLFGFDTALLERIGAITGARERCDKTGGVGDLQDNLQGAFETTTPPGVVETISSLSRSEGRHESTGRVFLRKPFNETELLDAVARALLNRHRPATAIDNEALAAG